MAVLYEYYNTGDDGSAAIWGVNWETQTFTPTISHNIASVKLKLRRLGSPGTLTISIKATDADGKPTGSDLTSGTTNGNTLPIDPNTEWREITFGEGTQLSANVKYSIVARALSGTLLNAVHWRVDETTPTYNGGELFYSTDSGTTWVTTGSDALFEDWGAFIPKIFYF